RAHEQPRPGQPRGDPRRAVHLQGGGRPRDPRRGCRRRAPTGADPPPARRGRGLLQRRLPGSRDPRLTPTHSEGETGITRGYGLHKSTRRVGRVTVTTRPTRTKSTGAWADGDRTPLNHNEAFKQEDDALNVRQRIIDVYAERGFDSIAEDDLTGRFRWM